MQTNDTDVVVILVAYMPDFLEIDCNVQVSAVFGVGFNTSCMSVNAIAAHIALKWCKELLCLHSLSGCDYTSCFFHVSRQKSEIFGCMARLKNSVVSKTFLLISNRPTSPLAEENLKVI